MAQRDTIRRLTILDYGRFLVHENNRIIGLPGYLLQTHDGENILVDTGFPAWYVDDIDAASEADGLGSFGVLIEFDALNLPTSQLALAALTPADIDILIITHTDIDHVGGIADFPGATIVIAEAERALPRPRYFADQTPIAWPPHDDWIIVTEDMQLRPGIQLLTTPGHSPGQLSLQVRLPKSGAILLTSDAISRPGEIEEGFPTAWDADLAKKSAQKLMAIAQQAGAKIIYGHDPNQWDALPKAPQFYS